jgi:hypothetical protein
VTTEYKRDACAWCEGKDYCQILREEPDCANCPLSLQCVRTPQFSEGNCDHMMEQWRSVLSPKIETDEGLLVPDLQRKITCELARELLIENLKSLHIHVTELTINKDLFRDIRPHMSLHGTWRLSCPRCDSGQALLGYTIRPGADKEKRLWVTQISMVCTFCGLDEKVDVP